MPRIEVNGVELQYQWQGDGPVLVLANGLFQRLEAWEPLMAFLGGFRVLRYDMRGQGRSQVGPGPYPPHLHVADLLGLLRALGVSQYHLLGLSNGGVVGQLLASQRPQGLQKLILLCTTPQLDPALLAKVQSWRVALHAGGTPARLKVALPWVWGRPYLETHPEMLGEIALEQMVLAAPLLEAQYHLLDGFLMMPDLRPLLGQISVPTLVLAGEEDLLFPPLYGRSIAQQIPGARFAVLPGVGHVPISEHPAGLATVVLPFLEVV